MSAAANAALVVNTLLELGHTSGGAGTTNTFGALFVNGGSVSANTIAAGAGSGTNVLALNNGTLIAAGTVGTPAAPIAIVALTNSAFQFAVTAGVTNLVAASLVTGGSSNVISVSSLPAIASVPAQFPLMEYSGPLGGAGFNFALGSLPAGAGYQGCLSNNLASRTVDLVITNYIPPDPFLTWDGTFDGDWDTETANWKNNIAADLIYADGTAVVFNDSAAGATNVNLTDTFAPASVTVSNNAKTFAFLGPGNLTGPMALTKRGSGTLLLGCSNTYSGDTSSTAARWP